MLRLADPKTSVTLIELFRERTRTVLIQDFANGGTLQGLLERRRGPLRESEVQLVMQKLTQGLNQLYQRKVIHRDINITNIMLHFKQLEPTEEELQDPELVKKMESKRKELVKDLTKVDFEVKITDYGLSRFLLKGERADTLCGKVEVMAPEAMEAGFD